MRSDALGPDGLAVAPRGAGAGPGFATGAVAWVDPLDAYAALQRQGRRPVLMLGAGRHPEARRTVLAFDPVLELRIEAHRWAMRRGDDVWEPGAGDPWDAVCKGVRALQQPCPTAGAAPGWYGFFGYEAANLLEPTLPEPRPRPWPDALLRACPTVATWDASARTATVAAVDGAPWLARAPVPNGGRASAPQPGGAPTAQQRVAQAAQTFADVASGRPPSASVLEPASAASATTEDSSASAWTPSMDREAFEAAVLRLQERIAAGDLFQANLATRFSTRAPATQPVELLRRLREANPSPFMGLLEADGLAIVSGSPEQLFRLDQGRIVSRPIAGTRRRGLDEAEDDALERELGMDTKEDAEHTMLVDLVRNDLARVARPGTVRVAQRKIVERYRHVMHLVSCVEAELRPGADAIDAFAALFPGGTITGAPKHRACMRIHEEEPVARGPYTGSMGGFGCDGSAQWNILIRTLVVWRGEAHVHGGSGIVADSVPAREWKESQRKAQALLDAATGAMATGQPRRVGEVTGRGGWAPAPTRAVARHARVLVVDNYDSFVHNLADYCAALGARVEVVRNDGDLEAHWDQLRPTHVVLGPGPGHPADSKATLRLAHEDRGVPVLGVCLGHQAMGLAHGGRIVRSGPVHGKADVVFHSGNGLLRGLPSPLLAARYHSLAVAWDDAPPWHVDARLADGTVMAIRHPSRPMFGLQFHPESVATEHGLDILRHFLEVSA